MTHRRTVITGCMALAAAAAGAGLAPSPAGAQTQQSRILADIQKRGTIRMATVAGNPPYSSVKPDGTPEGYDIEIGQQLAAALKVKPEWIVVDSPGRITALQTGKADVSIANFTATLERSTAIAFTRPYLIVGSNYMVKKDSPLQNVEQANKANIKIGLPRGGTAEDIAARVTPNATVVKVNTVTDAFLALKSGQVDAQILDSLQDAAFLSQEGAGFRNLPGNWSYEEISIGLPAGDGDWLRIVDTFVRQLIGSGEDARLFRKYFGYDMPPL
ncbi:transporter substrate-binding domain-containing protein [Limobrevibacterium gyesilva]|uniref:Transporter substrate-binding domain-containing protein n=1 Tax=Limobrevibacterium gyesilva TaxID=2991712 RepID=A0AA41YJ47_9PROT|nr:transporter substrate-binding domain-containing protein [Limobrevibacterium gyesilva]MCW3474591.1 transporter substrate-binding domain-containing protein [Limobrevibacterium gyesilva]